MAKQSATELDGWLEMHDKQADSVSNGKVVELSGTHYIHHNQSPRIAEELESFLKSSNS